MCQCNLTQTAQCQMMSQSESL